MDDVLVQAARLEAIMPAIMRGLFPADQSDPLAHMPLNQIRMLRLLDAESRTPSEAARELGMSMSALTQLADRLEESGMIERIPDQRDRRVRHLRPTERAREQLGLRRTRRAARAAEVLAHLSPCDRQQVLDALEALRTACAKMPPAASPESDADVEHNPAVNPAERAER